MLKINKVLCWVDMMIEEKPKFRTWQCNLQNSLFKAYGNLSMPHMVELDYYYSFHVEKEKKVFKGSRREKARNTFKFQRCTSI